MNINYPNREPVISRDCELRVVRRLPGTGETTTKVRAGERLSSEHVLARTDPKTTAVRISVADQLGVPPAEVSKLLMKPVGSAFGAGEALARNRKGLRNVVVASPIAGTLLSIDADTGMANIAPAGSSEIKSLIAGDVEFLDGKHSVSIRTVGTRVFGIVGIGNAATGPLAVVVSNPKDEFPANKVGPELAGKIVVAGAWVPGATIKKLIEVGAAGLVTGGFVDREIAAGMNAPAEDRLAPWRLKPGEQSIGEELVINLAMMATEGFGALPMHPDIFALLQGHNGVRAVLFTATRATGYLSRPQLLFVNEELLDEDADIPSATLNRGTRARLVDQASLGNWVEITGGPRRSRVGDGNMVEVVDVAFANGNHRTVPLANVEILG